MIDDKIVLEFLEFIAAKSEIPKDYAELYERVPEFSMYLKYLQEKGLIKYYGSFKSGEPRKHVTTIKGEFHHHQKFAHIELTAQGYDYLKEKKKSTLEKVKDEYREQGVSWFVTLTLTAISYVLGTLTPWLIQKFW